MQKISFGNKEYVKASEVAKRFRYTQDYVGQLCRSKKVDARLVGRTWYVEPDSVTAYRKTKHATQKGTAATKAILNKRTKRNVEPKPVVSVIRAKTARSTSSGSRTTSHSAINVTYGSDTEFVIPIVDKQSPAPARITPVEQSTHVPVRVTTPAATPATPAKKIKIIRSKDKQRKYSTEKMPEIALSGKLKVSETVEPPVGKREDPAVLAEASLAAAIGLPVVVEPDVVPVTKDTETHQRPASTRRVPASPVIKQASTPEVRFTPTQDHTTPARGTSRTLGYIVFVMVVIALAAFGAALVFSLTTVADVTASSPAMWSLSFDLSRLLSLRF